jgi:uncharacterized protein (TIGR03085 family)
MGVAREERRLLADLMTDLGPDAPTLCDPWRTRDLAAHLVLRERRFDAAPGIVLKPLSGYTQRVQDGLAAKPWPELLDQLREGPPFWSPYSIGPVDQLVNSAEFFVHHEDVRRAREGWEPRSPDPERDAVLWKTLRTAARISYRNSPVGVVLRRPDGAAITARAGRDPVVLTGQVGELVMHAFGRDATRIDFDGTDDAVAAVRSLNRSM